MSWFVRLLPLLSRVSFNCWFNTLFNCLLLFFLPCSLVFASNLAPYLFGRFRTYILISVIVLSVAGSRYVFTYILHTYTQRWICVEFFRVVVEFVPLSRHRRNNILFISCVTFICNWWIEVVFLPFSPPLLSPSPPLSLPLFILPLPFLYNCCSPARSINVSFPLAKRSARILRIIL